MRKTSYLITVIICMFISLLTVEAARGDLKYDITNASVSDAGITIEGYAFIHRTHNYVTVYKRDASGNEESTIVKANGGQKVKIMLKDSAGNTLEKIYECINTKEGYNFYYQMFYDKESGKYNLDTYNDATKNQCESATNGQCYYEDLGFKITFSIDELLEKFSSHSELSLYISAYNNDYGSFTSYEELKIPNVTGQSDYIEVTGGGQKNGRVTFIGIEGIFRKTDGISYSDGKIVGYCHDGSSTWCDSSKSTYYILKTNDAGFTNGFKIQLNGGLGGKDFLKNTKSPGVYAFCVYTAGDNIKEDACVEKDGNNFCTQCSSENANVLSAFSSFVALSGSSQLKIKIKNLNKCDVTVPTSGILECNNNKTFNSDCEKLTIVTDGGATDVTISQTGTISSVLTPNKIYAGGGFNFGILYHNTIKWSYVSESEYNRELHPAVREVMNNKLKDYESYIAGININLKIGGKTFNMVKQCTSSNESSFSYYNTELTVSCLFTIPRSEIELDGKVNYIYDAGSVNINNKYYTPMDYSGDINITADIVGMDRIKENVAKSDSKENGRKWTGDWSDTFTNCKINIYQLLKSSNFIYRPIDIFDPFPNRNAGINWFDWYNIARNKERLENTYSNIDYTVTLDNRAIADIKNYNDGRNYLEWDSIDEVTNESSFITEKNYIVRGGN